MNSAFKNRICNLLYELSEPISASDICVSVGKEENVVGSIVHFLALLVNHGIVVRENGEYRLADYSWTLRNIEIELNGL